MPCIRCGSAATRRDGQTKLGGQRWRCNECGRRFTERSSSAFTCHGFPDDLFALAVRWYLRYRLSYADVVEWFAEHGLVVDRSTIYRWVQRFTPLLVEAARPCRPRRRRPLVRRRDLSQGRRRLALRLPGLGPAQPGHRRLPVTAPRHGRRATLLHGGGEGSRRSHGRRHR